MDVSSSNTCGANDLANKTRSTNGKVQHAPDNKAWGHIDTIWPNFANDPKNIRLALARDGFNPFGEKSSSWSTWPVFVLNCNLPLWLVIKRFFMMLSLIIPSLESMKITNFDLYLEPMVEELHKLWKGGQKVGCITGSKETRIQLEGNIDLDYPWLP